MLRFIGVIDDKGAKTSKASAVFSKHDDAEFQKAFGDLVHAAYKDLFDLHGGGAWELATDKLISFFRAADETSDTVGKRQAQTFRALASLCGHGDPVKTNQSSGTKKADKSSAAAKTSKGAESKASAKQNPPPNHAVGENNGGGSNGVGLTVRIEINLPASGDQETYDRIFKSIRANLLNG